MQKTKYFITQNTKWKPLEEYILRIENFRESSPGLVIENCKSLIESIFKTIIVEIEKKTEDELKNDDIGALNKKVRVILHLEERGYSQIIGSFSNAIAQFRNSLGETSHGKDIYTLETNRSKLFEDELHFLLNTTDNIGFFLLSYYQNLYPGFAEKKTALKYDEQSSFNDWFDEQEPLVKIGNVSLLPSKTLFDGDVEEYKGQLAEYKEKDELVEGLRISPNFASTHSLVRKLTQKENFSEQQKKNIIEAFLFNTQVNWIAKDEDITSFFMPLFQENEDLFSEEESEQFNNCFI